MHPQINSPLFSYILKELIFIDVRTKEKYLHHSFPFDVVYQIVPKSIVILTNLKNPVQYIISSHINTHRIFQNDLKTNLNYENI